MPNTRPMTQRVELATVMDRLAVDGLITDYAGAVDDGDWTAYRDLFAPGGRADYRSAGGIEGEAGSVAAWLAESMQLFSMCQHLIVNRRIAFGILDQDTGDTARVRATTSTRCGWPRPRRVPRPARRTSSAAADTPSVWCGRPTAGG